VAVSASHSWHRAYVLHARPYRDTSLLLEVFAREPGRVGLVARGARGSRSTVRALLQPFRPLLLSWGGKGELATLHQAEADGPAQWPAGAVAMSGFYLNELLLRLLQRQDPHPALFDCYGSTVAALADPLRLESTLRIFERRLLEELGYGLLLEYEADSDRPIDPAGRYEYQLDRGPVPSTSTTASGVVVSGRSLLALARGELNEPGVLKEVKRLMRAALDVHVGGRPLKTREVLQQMSNTRSPRSG
jgi:DNA repair protein RecO (recombination protein O)